MQVYRLSDQSFAKILRATNNRTILFSSLTFAFFALFEVLEFLNTGEVNLLSNLFSFLVLIGIVIFISRKVAAQQQEIWQSTIIRVTEEYISSEQIRVPEVKIHREEIALVKENSQGLCIFATDHKRSLLITKFLDQADYLEIKDKLASWQPIESVNAKQNTYQVLLTIAYVIGFFFILGSPFIWLNALIGIGLLITQFYALRQLKQNPAVDPKYLKNYRRILIWMVFMVFMGVFGNWYLYHYLAPRLRSDPQYQPEQQSLNHFTDRDSLM